MSASSNNQRQIAPVPQGFGQHANFQYSNGSSFQNDWAKRAYRDTDDNEESPRKKTDTHEIVTPKPANDEKILSLHDRLLFATDVSIRYHNRRKMHYENVFKWMMLGVVIMAFGTLTSSFGGRIWLMAGVAALGMGTLVWNLTHKSREHAVIASEYQSLAEQIRNTLSPSEDDVRHWRNIRVRIQHKEPPVFWAVVNDCYFETARAWGMRPRERGLPPLLLRPFINWIRF